MKPYHKLECNNLKDIQQQVLSWIFSKNPAILDSKQLWNKIDTADLIASTPSLTEYFKVLKLKLRELAITVTKEKKDVDLHIDELPVTAKINIPILNTENSYNRWYEIPKELFESTTPVVNQFGKKYYTFKNIDYSRLQLLGEIELINPVVFNSQIAHNIILKENAKLPRIVLSCTFFKEPVELLTD
jgi:hypothetical protein